MSRSLLALLFVPLFFVACSSNNVTVDNGLGRYFDSANVKGSFGFFDNGQGHFTVYNLSRYRDSAYKPAGTFAIFESLVAIQNGMLKDDSSTFTGLLALAADSTGLPAGADKPQSTLRSYFQSPDTLSRAAFRVLSARLGDTLLKWIDSVHYGNRGMVNNRRDLGQLKITSDEQLGLIKRLYFDQLPFFKRPQQLVRGMIPAEKNSNYQLFYKSGQTENEDGRTIGWVLGWVEENKHPYFFVVNLESSDASADLGASGLKIVRGVLGQWGFFQGKK
jgi:beta-lactamase class D